MKAGLERARDLLGGYYQALGERRKPIAWCTSIGPAELLRSFGFEVYFPENHGALIGARRLGARLIPAANALGYSADICSYLTADIGATLMNESPLKEHGLDGPPRPDVLVFNTSQCREVKEWFDFYHRRWNVPMVGIHTPRDLDGASPALLAYLRGAYQDVIRTLEEISGNRYDADRHQETTSHSERACALWQDFLESNADHAARHNFFEHVLLMGPVVVLRGTPEAVAFYEALLEDVRSTPSPDTGRKRLYWDGMPVWGKNRFLADAFGKRGADVVASTYCHSWTFDFARQQGEDVLAATTRAYAGVFITRSQEWKHDYLRDKVKRFHVDGVVFHDAKTCPHNTNSRFGLPQRIREELNIPSFTFYGDLVDMRQFAEEEFTLRLEAFLEELHA